MRSVTRMKNRPIRRQWRCEALQFYGLLGKMLSAFGLSLRILFMRVRTLISFMLLAVLLTGFLLTGPGCATIVPPQGGPKDTLPPVLLRVTPADRSTNLDQRRIVFTFDEYIDLDNYQQNMIVSPVPKKFPTVSRRLSTLNVRMDTLEENTTYSLNFGRTIQDINEKNVYKNYTYVFSTGPYIDSLTLSGNVILAESGVVDTTLTVILQRSADDSAIIKERPRYIARLDGEGRYTFRNLPPGTFYLYALMDESGIYRYTSKSTMFAFADSAVDPSRSGQAPTLFAYIEKKEEVDAASTAPGTRKVDKRLKYTTNMRDRQDLLTPFRMMFEVPLQQFDSTRIQLSVDSTYTPVTDYRFVQDTSGRALVMEHKWRENTEYHLVLQKDFATDTLGQQLLVADTLDFTTQALEDYGRLNLRFRNLDLRSSPVLQLFQGEELVASFPLTVNSLQVDLFNPGEYTMRLLTDLNGNGKWDPGSFPVDRRQPELVKPLARKLNIRAKTNLPIEVDVNARPEKPARPGSPLTQPGQQTNGSTLGLPSRPGGNGAEN